jgi:hypothetical protein
MNILLSRVCERIEAAFMVNANYFCLPGEGRDPCFRLSEPVKQLQCLTERLSVRAGGAMGPGLRVLSRKIGETVPGCGKLSLS